MATLNDVNINAGVVVYPCQTQGITSSPIEGEHYSLSPFDTKYILSQLEQMGRLSLIEDTLQGLSQRLDGTKLKTAFPSLGEIKQCLNDGLMLPVPMLAMLEKWESLGATEISFDFVELV